MHHQHWRQGSNVQGEACIDRRERDEEAVSGGQENGDRCRDAGRMVVALEGLGHSLQVCKGDGAPRKVYGIRCNSTGSPQIIRT